MELLEGANDIVGTIDDEITDKEAMKTVAD